MLASLPHPASATPLMSSLLSDTPAAGSPLAYLGSRSLSEVSVSSEMTEGGERSPAGDGRW